MSDDRTTAARRRHHRARMQIRARRMNFEPHASGPTPHDHGFLWRDKTGTWRRGLPDWDAVFAYRASREVLADHISVCSCDYCGNPRRRFGERTRQEQRADTDAARQIDAARRGDPDGD